jgi:hypothetical protein
VVSSIFDVEAPSGPLRIYLPHTTGLGKGWMAVMATEQPQSIAVNQKIRGAAPEDKMVVDEADTQTVNG